MQSKQRVNDSLSVFLRNVKKKEGKTIAGTRSQSDPSEVLKALNRGKAESIEQLAQDLHESAYNIFNIVKQLETSELVSVEHDTDLVSLTDSGRTLAQYQELLTK